MHLYKTEKLVTTKSIIAAVSAFTIIMLFCVFASQALSGNVEDNKAETLKNAIDNAVVTCYSIEGRYPESLEYIVDNYGVIIDEEKFIVDYSVFASNVKPQVTVIQLEK